MGAATSVMLGENTFDNLSSASTHCAEDTLSNLGQVIYVAKYLKETGQMTGEKRKNRFITSSGKVYNVRCSTGKPGGGFATWLGDRSLPSAWVTAFASKIFSQGREFNILDDDPSDVICKAVEWMAQQQEPSGAYKDPYGVRHRPLTVRTGAIN